jgi:transposase-like protein
MGCYDTLLIDCPHCGEETSDQKKPGYMNTYRFGIDPIDDMEFEGSFTCEHCNKSFTVESESTPKMIVKKL